MPVNELITLYQRYACAMAYVEVSLPNGDKSGGTAFHVGDGVFVTAKHVVQRKRIISIATTERSYLPDPNGKVQIHGQEGTFSGCYPTELSIKSGPYFHTNENVDVAAIVVQDCDAPAIPLGGHLDDWLGEEFVLTQALVMGYPIVPFVEPKLIAAKAEINAVVDKYTGGHPQFIVSATARGGFSGGACISELGFALGVITESLVPDNKPTELGYLSVLSVEPIWNCLQHHKILPEFQKDGWDGFWDR